MLYIYSKVYNRIKKELERMSTKFSDKIINTPGE